MKEYSVLFKEWIYKSDLQDRDKKMLKKSKKDKAAEEKKTAPECTEEEQITTEEAAEAAESNGEDELSKLKNQYIRLMADFDNYRKRQSREREEYVKRSNERLLADILPVLDNLELALKKIEDPEDPFATGVKLVYDQFRGVLTRCGMEPVEALGEEFDPEKHEALSYIPSPTVEANKVIDQFRCGWLINGHLMRAAQVVVSSGKPEESDEAEENVSD